MNKEHIKLDSATFRDIIEKRISSMDSEEIKRVLSILEEEKKSNSKFDK